MNADDMGDGSVLAKIFKPAVNNTDCSKAKLPCGTSM